MGGRSPSPRRTLGADERDAGTRGGRSSDRLPRNPSNPRKTVSAGPESDFELSRRHLLQAATVTGVLIGSSAQVAGENDSEPAAPDVVFDFEVNHDFVESSPTIVDGVLYFGDGEFDEDNGTVYAYDLEADELRWQYDDVAQIRSDPQVVDGELYVADTDGDLHAFEIPGGSDENVEHKWTFRTEQTNWSSPTRRGDIVSVGMEDGHLYALNVDDGSQKWSKDIGYPVHTSPTIVDGIVYVADTPDESDIEGWVHAFDAEDGSEVWTFEDADLWFHSSPTVDGDTVVVGNDDSTLYALNSADGSVDWTFTEPDAHVIASPTVHEGVVYVATDDTTYGVADDPTPATLYAVEVETGEEIWNFDVPVPDDTDGNWSFHSSPTVVGETVYIGNRNGTVYAVRDGEEVWSYDTGDQIWSSPTVVDGTLYIGSDDGHLYGFDIEDSGSSEGSRVELGTHGHHDTWATRAVASPEALVAFEVTPVEDPVVQGAPLEVEITEAVDGTGQPVTGEHWLEFQQLDDQFDPVRKAVEFEDGKATVVAMDGERTTAVQAEEHLAATVWLTEQDEDGEWVRNEAVTATYDVTIAPEGLYSFEVETQEQPILQGNPLYVDIFEAVDGSGEPFSGEQWLEFESIEYPDARERGLVTFEEGEAETITLPSEDTAELAPGEYTDVTIWRTDEVNDAEFVRRENIFATYDVLIAPEGLTLAIDHVEVPEVVSAGEMIEVGWTVENVGAVDGEDIEWIVSFEVIGTGEVYQLSDTFDLNAGQEEDFSTPLEVPELSEEAMGANIRIAVPEESVREFVEIEAPALVFEEVEFPESSVIGDVTTITATIENVGTGSAIDQEMTVGLESGDDAIEVSEEDQVTVDPGETVEEIFEFRVPVDAQWDSLQHFIASPHETVREEVPFDLPELTILEVDAPEELVAGRETTVPVTLENTGAFATDALEVRVMVHEGFQINPYAGSTTVGIEPGEVTEARPTVELPAEAHELESVVLTVAVVGDVSDEILEVVEPFIEAVVSVDPADAIIDEVVEFDAGDSTGEIETVEWTVPDATDFPTEGEAVTHAFHEPGTYEVEVRVEDDLGNTDTTTVMVTVEAGDDDDDPDDEDPDDTDEADEIEPADEDDTQPAAKDNEPSPDPDDEADDSRTDSADEDDDSQSGFGIGGAVTAIGGAAYALRSVLGNDKEPEN